MKTVFFTIAILFSFLTINAQATIDTAASEDMTMKASKVDFFKVLVEKNNFNIIIKEINQEVATTTKNDFYNLLIEKNEFDIQIRNNIQLTHTPIHNTTKTAKTTQVVGLVP